MNIITIPIGKSRRIYIGEDIGGYPGPFASGTGYQVEIEASDAEEITVQLMQGVTSGRVNLTVTGKHAGLAEFRVKITEPDGTSHEKLIIVSVESAGLIATAGPVF